MARSLTAGALRRSDRTIMIVAVVLALIAGALVFVAVSSSDSGSKSNTPTEVAAGTTAVVTASQDIPANTKITADMLSVVAVPSGSVLIGHVETVDNAVGLLTRYPILAGEQLTGSKIGEDVDDDKSLNLVVPDGMRAISIPVEEENIVGGLILPSDWVDVIAVPNTNSPFNYEANVMLQNVQILAVAESKQDAIARPVGTIAPGTELGETPDDAEANPDAGTVTLAVTPDQGVKLALYAREFTLYLMLRARGDGTIVEVPAQYFATATPEPTG